jgi:enhancer of polycomb-like protein
MATPGTPQMMAPNVVQNGIAQNGRAQPIKRPSSAASQPAVNSPTPSAALTPQQQQHLLAAAAAAGQGSPQIVNGTIIVNGKPFVPAGVPGVANGVALDAAAQQRLAAVRLVAAQQQQAQAAAGGADLGLENMTPEQRRELLQLAQQNGFGNNVQAYIALKRSMTMKQQMALQQAQAQAISQAQIQLSGTPVANGAPQPGFPSPLATPAMTPAQLQLKLPAHAAARLAGNTPPTPQAQAQRS